MAREFKGTRAEQQRNTVVASSLVVKQTPCLYFCLLHNCCSNYAAFEFCVIFWDALQSRNNTRGLPPPAAQQCLNDDNTDDAALSAAPCWLTVGRTGAVTEENPFNLLTADSSLLCIQYITRTRTGTRTCICKGLVVR